MSRYPHQTRVAGPTLVQCWARVAEDGPTVNRQTVPVVTNDFSVFCLNMIAGITGMILLASRLIRTRYHAQC